MWSKILLILIIVGFLHCEQLYSQTPSYYHYTSSDGLASSTVYQIIQDQKGFIWFATTNGISKFDGTHFTTLRTVDGLNSNSIISLAEGKGGELYIGNYEKGINVLKNNKIENYCSEINGGSFALSYLLLEYSENKEQKLFAYRKSGQLIVIHEKTNHSRVKYNINPNPQNLVKLEKLPNGKIVGLTNVGLFEFKEDLFSKLHIPELPDTTVFCLSAGSDSSYFIGTNSMICQIKNNRIIRRYPINLFRDNNDVIELLSDKNNNLWFSIMNKGFFLIPNGSNEIIDVGKKMGLEKTLVNNYLEDREGNIWLSAFGKGVFCLNHLYFKSYSEDDGLSSNNVYSIEKEKSGKLIIGTFNGINVFENGRFDQLRDNSGKALPENISSIKKIENDFYICGTFGGHEIINHSYQGIQFHLLPFASFCKTSQGPALYGYWFNFIYVQNEFSSKIKEFASFYLFGDSTKINRVNDIYEDTQGDLWVGTGLGLCKISTFSNQFDLTKWKKSFFPLNPVLNSRIRTITAEANKIWFAGEKGIACYHLNNDSIETYSSLYGYDLSSSTSMAFDHKKRLWIGTMNGLYLWDGKSIQLITRQAGLPSNEIFSLCYDQEINQLYIGTSNGISFLDLNLFDHYIPPKLEVQLLSIKAGDSINTNYNNLIFKPEQNHVYIDFKALCFSSPGAVKYKYKLKGEWKETEHDFLDLMSLQSGSYKLQIMAKLQNTTWSKPLSLSFRVLPRFAETFWFILLIILSLGVISVTLMLWWLYQYNKKVRKELDLNERFNELKHQALSAMMNPHFIFNSLNSVQYLINCQKNEDANHYIATMAKLIRKNLDTAGNGFIFLSEEIYRLNLYLELEKLRFQDGFTYEIITGTGVDSNTIMIPNMIIQPFVENTLWHGIINSGSKGMVTILFSFEDVEIDSIISKSLIIKITDNGIGINAARKNKKEDHISKGIQIIEERLQLLSTKMHLQQPIMLEDLSLRDNNSHGTEVIISLPPQLYKMVNPPSESTSSSTV